MIRKKEIVPGQRGVELEVLPDPDPDGTPPALELITADKFPQNTQGPKAGSVIVNGTHIRINGRATVSLGLHTGAKVIFAELGAVWYIGKAGPSVQGFDIKTNVKSTPGGFIVNNTGLCRKILQGFSVFLDGKRQLPSSVKFTIGSEETVQGHRLTMLIVDEIKEP